MKKKLFLLCLMIASLPRFCYAQNIEGQIVASQYGEFKVVSNGNGYAFEPDACAVSGGGKNFAAFSNGVPVKVVDSNPAMTEVSNSTVFAFINSSSCSVSMGGLAYAHTSFYLTSGTGGLQEAINNSKISAGGPNTIILNSEWYALVSPGTPSAVIASVKGNSQLGLVDVTTTPYTTYSWNGTQYVAASTGSAVTVVTGSSPIVSSGGTTPNLTLSALTGAQVISLFASVSGCAISGNALNPATGNCLVGSGGASTPATFYLYKGNGSVNGVLAATPGADYNAPNASNLFGPTGTATSGANYSSNFASWCGSYWTGSASAQDCFYSQDVVTSGTNPSTLLNFHAAGSSGGHAAQFNYQVQFPSGITLPTNQLLPGIVATNPGSNNSQQVQQTGTSTLGVTNLNKVFHVEGFPSTCTTNEGSFTTQLECAWFSVFDYAVGNSAIVELDMGYGYYIVNHSLYEPTTNFTGISLVGAGVEGGSTILANAVLSDAVIYKNETNAGATWPQLNFRDFAINGEDQAQGCIRLWGVQNPVIKNVGCNSIPNGAPFFFQFGEPNNYGQGWVFGAVIDNVGAANNGTISLPAVANRAIITPTVSGGGIATNGYVVSSGGSGYPQPSAEVVLQPYLLGNENGTSDKPCTTMPTGLAATVNGSGVITGVTSATAASGCSGNIYVAILPQTNLTIAGEDIWASDSRIYNSGVYGVGTCFETHSGNTLFFGVHPTNCGTGILATSSGGSTNSVFRDTELDTLVQYGFDIENSGNGGVIEGTNAFNNFPDSFSPFHIAAGATMQFGPQASLSSAGTTDYHEFLMPYGTFETQGYLPEGSSVCPNDTVGSTAGCILGQPLTLDPSGVATSSTNYSSPPLTFEWSSWNGSAPAVGSFTIQAIPNGGVSAGVRFTSQVAGSAFGFGNPGNSPATYFDVNSYLRVHSSSYFYGNNFFNQTSGVYSDFGTSNQLAIDSNGESHDGTAAPTASAGTLTGTNAGGFVTGLSAATSLTITFANSGWSTWASCVGNAGASGSPPYVSAISKTAVTFTFAALTGAFYYQCNGN